MFIKNNNYVCENKCLYTKCFSVSQMFIKNNNYVCENKCLYTKCFSFSHSHFGSSVPVLAVYCNQLSQYQGSLCRAYFQNKYLSLISFSYLSYSRASNALHQGDQDPSLDHEALVKLWYTNLDRVREVINNKIDESWKNTEKYNITRSFSNVVIIFMNYVRVSMTYKITSIHSKVSWRTRVRLNIYSPFLIVQIK